MVGFKTQEVEGEEAGNKTKNHAMSTVMEYQNLIKFWEL